jgi:ATP-dependent protease ClpP protease subunit
MNTQPTLICLAALLLGGCVSGDLALVSKRAEQVQLGFTYDQVVAVMGKPQATYTDPIDTERNVSLSCIFGVHSSDGVAFFFYKDKLYAKAERPADWDDWDKNYGLYFDKAYSNLTCYGNWRVNWAKTPTPPEIIAQRRANVEAERVREAARRAREAQIITQEYFIDGLVIVHTQDTGTECASGGDYKIKVRGDIGPDSSFALEELLIRSPNCLQANRKIKSRTTVELESLGGFLKDGYLMGRTFRTHEVRTIITNNTACASSCAVAYLGGTERLMENDSIIMFHSPYLPDLNALGERIANCDIDSTTTNELLKYYQEMTSPEQGERLFDRTMSYCSAEDGWILRGSAAAELFGVATQI